MKRAGRLLGAAFAATLMLAMGTAHAVQQTGMVKLPCTHGSVQANLRYVPAPALNGTCGFKVNVTEGVSFTLTPGKPADLDIYFYSASWQWTGVNTAGLGVCGRLKSGEMGNGNVPNGSSYGIVVLNVSECGNVVNVPFTFTQP